MMEGEVVFYDRRDLDELEPRARIEMPSDTTSPLGQLYAKWNAANQRARDEYDRRNYEIWRSDRVWKGMHERHDQAGSAPQ